VRVPKPLPALLPQGDQAVVKRDKVLRYLLDPKHQDGGHKARRFREVFGYKRADAERLRADLRAAAASGRVVNCRLARPSGLTWTVEFEITGPNGQQGTVRSNWHMLAPGTAPRFTTAWVET
jgi:hypothetical protein